MCPVLERGADREAQEWGLVRARPGLGCSLDRGASEVAESGSGVGNRDC